MIALSWNPKLEFVPSAPRSSTTHRGMFSNRWNWTSDPGETRTVQRSQSVVFGCTRYHKIKQQRKDCHNSWPYSCPEWGNENLSLMGLQAIKIYKIHQNSTKHRTSRNDVKWPDQSISVLPRGHGMNDRSSNPNDCRGAIALVSLRYAVLCCARIQVQCQNKLCHSNQRSKRTHVTHRSARYIKIHQVSSSYILFHGISWHHPPVMQPKAAKQLTDVKGTCGTSI